MRRLSWPDRWLLLSAALLVPAISVALRPFGVRRVLSALSRWIPAPDEALRLDPANAAARVLEIAHIVDAASRHTPLANTCLHRSLALWWLLKRRGFDSSLRYGARKQAGRFEAHAWVEHDGVVVNDLDSGEHGYVELGWTALEPDA